MRDPLRVTTLGEALVVMDPLSKGPLRHVGTFEKHLGGAEFNVAVGLSRLGHAVGWAGGLGDDEFGEEILAFARGERVDVSRAILDPDAPTGLYFKEWRALGQLRVHYYRAGSAASRMRFDGLDVEYLLSGEILHLTGITAALSDSCHGLISDLISAANERGVTVSFDLNVRHQLLKGRDPREVLGPLAARADLLFLSEDESGLLFGGGEPEHVRKARRDIRAATVVVHGAEGAFAVEEEGIFEMPAYSVSVVDTVGAGDAFVAGFLSGRLRGWSTGECLDLANACGACAVTVPGDLKGLPTEEEAFALRRGLGAQDAGR
ncbi:sugar kinase [Rubrobacter tropicus]|uniref:Sugar kinase n=1 Tax=Rubrobacter tropicus TaxID=2653851 RepID=A0A6G8Q6U0_9ACTN|nr:sugar kinase [Rubrobacter tropicus]QIN82204.1 sugar kinase [Rubrobacter tropicus]